MAAIYTQVGSPQRESKTQNAFGTVLVQNKDAIRKEFPTLSAVIGRGFMPRSYGNTFLFSLAIFFAMISSGSAAQFFAGRWHYSGESPVSIGVIQYGETVALFSKAGWAMLLLAPEAGGILASGEGNWSFDNTSTAIVNVTIGYRGDRLYLLIVPKDESGPAEYKIILDRIEPKLANRRT